MEIKKILVPVDFSPCSINALKIACGLAKGQGASLHIINAIQVPPHPDADLIGAGALAGSLYSKYTEDVDEQFEDLKKEVPLMSKISYTTEKFVPPITDAIQNCIKNNDIDLVVMGTKEKHSNLEKLIGSVSSDVIKLSKVPVLVIPGNIDSLHVENIGFAADLKKIENIQKLEFLKYIAEVSGAEIKIFHVSQTNDAEHLADLGMEKMKIVDFLGSVKHSYVWIAEEDILDGINDFMQSHKLDMLAMYPRHHGFWDSLIHSSITSKVVNNARIPLLTFHE